MDIVLVDLTLVQHSENKLLDFGMFFASSFRLWEDIFSISRYHLWSAVIQVRVLSFFSCAFLYMTFFTCSLLHARVMVRYRLRRFALCF